MSEVMSTGHALPHRFESCSRQHLLLLPRHAIDGEILDGLVEQAVEVELGAQVQEYAAESDRGAIHEYKFPRHPHRAFFLQRLVNTERFTASVLARLHAVGETTHAVVEQRPVDEARPDVQYIVEVPRETLESPGLVCMHNEFIVAAQQSTIKV